MRIGVDIDGVLANFNSTFIERVIVVTGRDLFPPRPFDIPCWDYPQHYGYTADELHCVWDGITSDAAFWLSLPPYWDAPTILERLRAISDEAVHDLYFITSRPGLQAKRQTEVWLGVHSGDFLHTPTVLISGDKGRCAKALNLDRYIDDRWENCVDVVSENLACDVFLMDRPWNQGRAHGHIRRVTSVNEMLDTVPGA